MYTGILRLIISCYAVNYCNRTWKGHLRGTAQENQVELYQMICLLEAEENPTTFDHLMKQFIKYWTPKEQTFAEFFKQHYASRPGKFKFCIACYDYGCHRNMGKML